MLELLFLALLGAGASIFVDNMDDDEAEPQAETDEDSGLQPQDPDEADEEDPFPEGPEDPDPVDPIDPGPVDPGPVDPDPVDPIDPDPVDPIDPDPVDPIDPDPVDPIDPDPVDPIDPDPVDPIDPDPVDPVEPDPVGPFPTEPEPQDPTIDPTQVSVPSRDADGNMVLRDGTDARGNAEDNTFVGPTLEVETPMGTIRVPGGPFEDVNLHMGRGDDSIVGSGSASEIYGNGGDDVFALGGSDNTLSGGEGNDEMVITSGGGTLITGGLGNDAVQFTRGAYADAGDTVYGGEGSDTLHAQVTLSDADVDPLQIYGGAGADNFGLVIEEVEVPATAGGVADGVVLMDFNAAQDSVTVVLSTEAQLNYTGATLVNHPAQGYAELRLNFADQAGGAPYQAVIHLNGNTSLSVSDIDLRLQT